MSAAGVVRGRWAWVLAWIAVLALGSMWLGRHLELSGDLRRFLPEARTPEQRLLLDEVGEGPGSRLLLLALSGGEPRELARQSSALVAALSGVPGFAMVTNGDVADVEAVPAWLRPYRYLLAPTLDTQPFDAPWLHAQLQQRVQDLGSPAGGLLESLLPSDPTLEWLALVEAWEPESAPRRQHGVWFNRAGNEALLLAQTVAPGFDPDGQAAALAAITRAHAEVGGGGPAQLTVTGPGAFAVEVGGRTRREASRIGSLDGVAFALLLLLAYRSWKAPLLGALPLASGGLAGLAAVALGFDGVHGITVAFGFTLVGVAQDYPIHLFSHQRPGISPWTVARSLWPTLGTGVVATCLAYLTFFVSGVDGLRQLAVFTIVGLAVAALGTRYLLPALLDRRRADVADDPRLLRAWRQLQAWPRLGGVACTALAAAALAVVTFAPGEVWQNDLARLTPVPAAALERDARLRAELGAPDVRYVVAVPGVDTEAALQVSERLLPVLRDLRAQGRIDSYELAARYLPSAATQRARQARLPAPDAARALLAQALQGTPFREDVFTPFLADLEAARQAPPLTFADLAGTPLAGTVAGLLRVHADGAATAMVALGGLAEPGAVAAALAPHGARLIDLKQASETLVADYRVRLLWALALAALLLAAVVGIALRDWRRTARVLAPMALTTLLVLAVLRAAGVELNLFHLVALILAAGLGLDYALFFDHAGDRRAEQLRALHAIIVCSLTTLLVFALLASSSIPVLRAIGSTVALGVLFNFVLALLVVRRPAAATGGGDEAAADGATGSPGATR